MSMSSYGLLNLAEYKKYLIPILNEWDSQQHFFLLSVSSSNKSI